MTQVLPNNRERAKRLLHGVVRWWRRLSLNRLDEDWEELKAMPDAELCAEFDRLLDTDKHSDRCRRACYVMGMRFYERHKEPARCEGRTMNPDVIDKQDGSQASPPVNGSAASRPTAGWWWVRRVGDGTWGEWMPCYVTRMGFMRMWSGDAFDMDRLADLKAGWEWSPIPPPPNDKLTHG